MKLLPRSPFLRQFLTGLILTVLALSAWFVILFFFSLKIALEL